jgi:hypothetical protein
MKTISPTVEREALCARIRAATRAVPPGAYETGESRALALLLESVLDRITEGVPLAEVIDFTGHRQRARNRHR